VEYTQVTEEGEQREREIEEINIPISLKSKKVLNTQRHPGIIPSI
jgi:hypothetical protein